MSSSQHFLPTSLRAAIIAISLWVLSLSLTVLSGSVAAVIACFLACFLIDRNIHKAVFVQLRTTTIFAACLLLSLTGLLLGSLLLKSALISSQLSPMFSYNSGEFIKWFSLCAALTIALRTLSHRSKFGAVLEIFFVACAFVITLSAHRNGMIHRPFFLGDFAVVRGIDPAVILMTMGCATVLALASLLMIERNQRRLPYHFTMLGLLCFSLLIYIRMFGLPTPALTDGLGLTGQEGPANSGQQENPFRDSDNNTDNKEAPIAIVLFRDDYQPDGGSYYFRESAYSQFNGQMLDYTSRADMDQDLVAHFTNSRSEPSQQIPALDRRLAVRTSIGMLVAHRNPFGLDSPVAFENTPNPNSLRFKRSYDAYSMVPQFEFQDFIGQQVGREDWSDEVLQEYLQLPDDPRYEELAQSLIANLRIEFTDDPFAKAIAVKNYLDENGIYSLKNEHAYADDPAGSFLFGDLTGYCMHFSFAATYLFRSLGIPSRVGIGYSVPAQNRAGGSALLIQAIHGHAWPEIYLRDYGWVIVDPAPQQTLVDMSTDPQNDLQQLLGDMLRDEASFDDFLAGQQQSSFSLIGILRVVSALALLLLFLAYAIRLYRYWIPYYADTGSHYRLFYRASLDQLAAVGQYRHLGESREAFASRLKSLTPSFESLTNAHLAIALGGRVGTITAETGTTGDPSLDTPAWAKLSKAVSTEISSNSAQWKKWLAWLNPVSWLFSK